jgi:hypothetical protein
LFKDLIYFQSRRGDVFICKLIVSSNGVENKTKTVIQTNIETFTRFTVISPFQDSSEMILLTSTLNEGELGCHVFSCAEDELKCLNQKILNLTNDKTNLNDEELENEDENLILGKSIGLVTYILSKEVDSFIVIGLESSSINIL